MSFHLEEGALPRWTPARCSERKRSGDSVQVLASELRTKDSETSQSWQVKHTHLALPLLQLKFAYLRRKGERFTLLYIDNFSDIDSTFRLIWFLRPLDGVPILFPLELLALNSIFNHVKKFKLAEFGNSLESRG